MRIGIDLGGSKIEGLLLDEQGRESRRLRVATPAGDYPATLDAICDLVHELEIGLPRPASVGLCIPGTLSPDTGLVKNANSVCLIGQALDRDLEQRLQRRLRLANDADCFALSEASDGAAAGAASVFGVILGTGVGGGIVIGGKLLSGPNAIAGEWGHNPLPWPGEDDRPALDCYCGKQGCIETYLSGPGFARHYSHACLQQSVEGSPGKPKPTSNRTGAGSQSAHGSHSPNSVPVPEIMRRAQQGDPCAVAALERYAERLAKSLASVINILDPEVVVLGGGVANIAQLYQEVPARWGRYVFSDQVNTRLVKAQHGDSSGVRGAAWLWPG